jgi:hypothetical protein
VRFTQKPDVLYAVLLEKPSTPSVTLSGLRAEAGTTVSLPGFPSPLNWQQEGDGITISFPASSGSAPALALKLTPQPSLVSSGRA